MEEKAKKEQKDENLESYLKQIKVFTLDGLRSTVMQHRQEVSLQKDAIAKMNKIYDNKEDRIVSLLAYNEALITEKNRKEKVQLRALQRYERIYHDKKPNKQKAQDQDIPEDIVETEETQRGIEVDEDTKG